MSAKEVRAFRNLASKLVKTEETGKLLGNLISANIGVREIEEFVIHEDKKLKGNNVSNSNARYRREMVSNCMKIKFRDNWKTGVGIRKARNKLKGNIEEKLGPNSREFRGIMKSVNNNCMTLRMRLKHKNMKKLEFLKGKYGKIENPIDELKNEDRKKYGGARIFQEDNGMKAEEDHEPVIVCMEGEVIELDEDEKSVLLLGPKYCILKNLCEESFEREVEECVIKYRWELKKNEREEDEIKRFGEDIMENINCIFDEEELEQHDEDKLMEEAKARMVFDEEGMSFNFARKRVTDIKGNSRVILPKKAKNFELKAKLEMLRTECMGIFRQYLRENCGKYGKQKSNLTKSQLKGLKSLKQRIDNAEIVVVPTDKIGNFAIMTHETYILSGMKHTRDDIEVGWEVLEESQKEVNGHVAMLLKIFKAGENWDHVDRMRETMLGKGMSVCPITLLYKDHKGWTRDKGGVPPTRHVAGGHVGLNLYLSEIVSEITEPMVGTIDGGAEVISGEDLLANVDHVNEDMSGWHVGWTWEGFQEGIFEDVARVWGRWMMNSMWRILRNVNVELKGLSMKILGILI